MKDNKLIYILLFILPGLLMLACSQDDIDLPGNEESDDIIFHVAMPGVDVSSRSYDNIEMGQLEGGFTVASMCPERDGDGPLGLFFEKVLVERTDGMGNAFRGDGCKWPDNKNGKEGRLRFFAFYPSLETMRKKSGVFETGAQDIVANKEYFLLHDNPASNKKGTTIQYNYRLGNFKVNRDILRHMDLVAASVEGTKTDNLYSGVNLEFSHKLSRISFKAWGAPKGIAIEIAGIRIGNVIVSSTYNLAGNWLYGSATEKNTVEYIFRKDDTVVTIDGTKYNTEKTATSIMGNGGWAMIIPGNASSWKYTAWENTEDNRTNKNNNVYFSVLMRVTDTSDDDQGLILYPYVDNALITGTTVKASNKNAVYLVVEKTTGKVTKRIYRNSDKKTYYYLDDNGDKVSFDPTSHLNSGEELRTYAWAAIPAGPSNGWDSGKTYTYTLNYSGGVGVHEPGDDAPGKPIITQFAVGVSENEGVWKMVMDYENEERELKKDDFTQE